MKRGLAALAIGALGIVTQVSADTTTTTTYSTFIASSGGCAYEDHVINVSMNGPCPDLVGQKFGSSSATQSATPDGGISWSDSASGGNAAVHEVGESETEVSVPFAQVEPAHAVTVTLDYSLGAMSATFDSTQAQNLVTVNGTTGVLGAVGFSALGEEDAYCGGSCGPVADCDEGVTQGQAAVQFDATAPAGEQVVTLQITCPDGAGNIQPQDYSAWMLIDTNAVSSGGSAATRGSAQLRSVTVQFDYA